MGHPGIRGRTSGGILLPLRGIRNDKFVSLWGERCERKWRGGQRRGPSTARFADATRFARDDGEFWGGIKGNPPFRDEAAKGWATRRWPRLGGRRAASRRSGRTVWSCGCRRGARRGGRRRWRRRGW